MTSHLPNNRTGLLPGEDAFCNWVNIVQDGDDDDDDDDDSTYTQNVAQTPAQNSAHQSHLDLLPESFIPGQKRKDKLSCPPKEGKAQITSTILLLGGYVPEAKYTVKVKATEEGEAGRTILDLWTEFDLGYKDGVVVE